MANLTTFNFNTQQTPAGHLKVSKQLQAGVSEMASMLSGIANAIDHAVQGESLLEQQSSIKG